MEAQIQLKADPLPWLMEPDPPGVSYLALRDLLDRPEGDPELQAAREAAHTEGPIAAILAAMDEAGYWVRPGPGYNPKYRSAVWSLTMLAQLGASIHMDHRIAQACTYLLEHALTPQGQFSVSGSPSGTIDCLQGNLCNALLDLGIEAARLDKAFEWMARSITGEGVAPIDEKDAPVRYYAYKCGPLFACGVNSGNPCAWGGAKDMLALSKLPQERRTPLIQRAIQAGVEFFFSIDPATARYPTRIPGRPSPNWWKFGFPVFYVTDLLQVVEALARLGYGSDPRLENALKIVHDKQDQNGRWKLEYEYTGKTWADFGAKGQPNKWVTLRAMRTLKFCS